MNNKEMYQYFQERNQQMADMFRSGMSLQEIADHFQLSTGSIHQVLEKFDLSAFDRRYPKSKLLDQAENEIVELYKSGTNAPDIAKKFGVSLHCIYNRLDKHGVERRPWKGPHFRGKENHFYKNGKGSRRSHNWKYLIQMHEVVAICTGKLVPRGCQIHHINENELDNRPENLALFPNKSGHALCHQQLLRLRRKGLPADAIQAVLENGGQLLPPPPCPIQFPPDKD